MKICILYYDGFCEFEVVVCAGQFRDYLETISLINKPYISEEKQKYLPDTTISEINAEDVDLLIVPGGNPGYLFDNLELKEFMTKLNNNNKYIAAICGGSSLLAKYGILDNKRCTGNSEGIFSDAEYFDLFKDSIIVNEDVVVDNNIITATGQSFIELAATLRTIMKIHPAETVEEFYKWYKNIK